MRQLFWFRLHITKNSAKILIEKGAADRRLAAFNGFFIKNNRYWAKVGGYFLLCKFPNAKPRAKQPTPKLIIPKKVSMVNMGNHPSR